MWSAVSEDLVSAATVWLCCTVDTILTLTVDVLESWVFTPSSGHSQELQYRFYLFILYRVHFDYWFLKAHLTSKSNQSLYHLSSILKVWCITRLQGLERCLSVLKMCFDLYACSGINNIFNITLWGYIHIAATWS